MGNVYIGCVSFHCTTILNFTWAASLQQKSSYSSSKRHLSATSRYFWMNYDRPVFSFFEISKIFLMSSPCWSPAWKFFLTSTQAHLSLDLCRLLSHGFSQKIPTLTQIPPLFGNKKCICRRDSQNHVAYTMRIGVLRHFGGYTKCQYI